MKIIPLIGTIFERHKTDNAKASAARVEAIQEYNIMMGILEDPAEDEDTEETEGTEDGEDE